MPTQLNRRHVLLAGAGVATAALASAEFSNAKTPAPKYAPAVGVAKLNANENPFGPSKAAIAAAYEATKSGAYYVSESVPRLKSMIAEKHNLAADNVALSSGSSGVLSYLAAAKASQGNILGPDLFWDTTAKMGTRHQGKIVYLPKTADLSINLDAMLAAITPDVSLVHITNPNNPTGLALPPEKLTEFCKAAAKKCTVLVDEAYNELTDAPEVHTMAPLIQQGYDIFVARTFSKIYGMAGMRVGYMLASEANIALLNQHGLGDYAMNQAGVAAAVACYHDERHCGSPGSCH